MRVQWHALRQVPQRPSVPPALNPDPRDAGLLEGGDTLQRLLSKAGSEPKLFMVDYWEPYRSYADRIDAQDGVQHAGDRKQHAGRLLLYKKCGQHPPSTGPCGSSYYLLCLATADALSISIWRRASATCMSALRQQLPMRKSWAAELRRPALADRKSTGHLLPVAIELWHADGSPDGKTAVYTPANSHGKVCAHANSSQALHSRQAQQVIIELTLQSSSCL